MKIALCFYGQPRFLEEAYKLSFKKILDKFTPDVYVHTWWDKELVGTPYSVADWAKSSIIKEDLLYKPNTIDKIIELYNPKKYQIDSPVNHFSPPKPHNYYQFYTQYAVKELVKDNYDIIIRSRFDMKILQPLPIEITPNLVVSNSIPNNSLLNDLLSISNQENYNKISNIYLNLEEFNAQGVGEREYAFKAQVDKENIPYSTFNASYNTFDVFRSKDKL